MKKLSRSSGQALLIVLLSMAVILTVVLSVLSSSITDVAVTSREEEALRAFSAAEAGIEQALIAGVGGTSSLGNSTFTTSIATIAELEKDFNYPQDLLSGDTGVIWYIAHGDTAGKYTCSSSKKCFKGKTAQVCWGNPGTQSTDSKTPALELITYYVDEPGNYKTTKIMRMTVDPNVSRTGVNNFTQAVASKCTIDGKDYAFQTTLDLSAASSWGQQGGLLFTLVKSIYNTDTAHSFGVNVDYPNGSQLPSQGRKIVSTGTAGEATRKVEVSSLYRAMPAVFTNSIFTLGGITK